MGQVLVAQNARTLTQLQKPVVDLRSLNTSRSVGIGTISIMSATTLARMGDGMNAKSVVGLIPYTNARNRGTSEARLLFFRQIGH
jgi:hypothetical protein